MTRNRMIKAEFWADEKVAKCNFIARLLFIGSWNFADDSGVCRANSVYLRNNIFPYDSINIKDVDNALVQLEQNGLISFGESKGEKYFLIINFMKHQVINRPSEYRYVKSPYDKVFNQCSLQTHGGLSEGSPLKVKEKVKVKVNENVVVEEKKEEETTTTTSAFSENPEKTQDASLDEFKNDLANWHGEYQNVHLTKNQYDTLLGLVTSKDILHTVIEELSAKIAIKEEPLYDDTAPYIHYVRLKSFWQHYRNNPSKLKALKSKLEAKEDFSGQGSKTVRIYNPKPMYKCEMEIAVPEEWDDEQIITSCQKKFKIKDGWRIIDVKT